MAGLEAARNRGHRPGRPIAVKPEQYETVLLLRGQGRPYRDIASATGLSASTVARICEKTPPATRRTASNRRSSPFSADRPAGPGIAVVQ
ncbi:hypothetical protein GCM10009592_27600 [Brachybacterium rhamnosum]|uniref:Helix-turn-helix domain-containing protein n=1 Tax=Brachybacterium rhamnosum TaxID=173361 RepID=A0ABW4Q3M1_9MICO